MGEQISQVHHTQLAQHMNKDIKTELELCKNSCQYDSLSYVNAQYETAAANLSSTQIAEVQEFFAAPHYSIVMNPELRTYGTKQNRATNTCPQHTTPDRKREVGNMEVMSHLAVMAHADTVPFKNPSYFLSCDRPKSLCLTATSSHLTATKPWMDNRPLALLAQC